MAFISIPGHGRVQPRGSVRVSAEWDDYVEAAYLAGNESGIPDAVERDTDRVSLEGGGVATVINGGYNNTVGGVFLPGRLDFKGRRLGVVAGLWLRPNNTVLNNTYPAIWSIRDNSSELQSLHIGNFPPTYTPFCVGYRGNSANVSATTLALPLPTGRGRTVLEGNSFSANVKIFYDGQPTALYRDAYSADIPLNNTIQPVIGNRSTGGRAFTHDVGAIEYMLFLRQDLEQERRESLIDDPYQIFIPDRRRKYSLPSGPISLAINSITASNITSSGARITLGLTR